MAFWNGSARVALSLAAGMALLLAVAACGNGDSETTTATTETSTTTTTTAPQVAATAVPAQAPTDAPAPTGASSGGAVMEKAVVDRLIFATTTPNNEHSDQRVFCCFDALQLRPMYENLLAVNPAGEFVPGLATSWTLEPDGQSMRLELREGVEFPQREWRVHR